METSQLRKFASFARQSLLEQVETYCNDLGNTGFAAMNVLTDFASRPVHLVGGPSGRIHSLQVTSGIWIEDFAEEARKRDFHITHYLGPDFDIAT